MSAAKKKIVILTSAHPWNDNRIFHKEALTLEEAGYQIVLVGRGEQSRDTAGIQVKFFDRPVGGNKITRVFRIWKRMLAEALQQRGDVYHFHDPELLPMAIALRLMGKRVIYDVHETYTKQLLSAHWVPPIYRTTLAWMVGLAEKLGASVFNGVVAATPNIGDAFPSRKTVVVQNFVKETGANRKPNIPYQQRDNNICYVGGMSKIRGVFEMVEAVGMLDHQHQARLILGGVFSPTSLKATLEANPTWSNVEYFGWLDRQEVFDVLTNSRVGLAILHPEPNYLDSYPTKLFEYMLAGLPVVASNFPFWRQFVDVHKCGLMVDPLNPAAIAEAIEWLLTHPEQAEAMGQRGREAAERYYSWQSQADKLTQFYRDVVFG